MAVEPQQATSLALLDIHLPDPVSWWPPAPGWWLVASLLLLALVAFYLQREFKRRKLLQKTALAEFESIRAEFQHDHNTVKLVQSLSILLRRSCISFYPRASSAGLTGERWLDYLDTTSGKSSDQTGFKTDPGRILATAPYLPKTSSPDIDADALLGLCEAWLHAQPVNPRNQPDART